MPAGTIALTNNSTALTGSGTSFTTELKANDFIVAIVGGVTYTLGVQSVNSATGVSLITAYNGPTASGVAWTAVPNAALVGITAQVAADVAKAIRGLNLDKANWQQIFTGTGNVTVNLPDGTSWTGPAWNGIASSISGKMDKGQNLNDVADKASARTNLGVAYGSTAGTVAQGNDTRITGALQKSGGTMTGLLLSDSQTGFKKTSTGWRSNANDGYNYMMEANGPDTTTTLQHALYVNNGNYWASRFIITIGSVFRLWEMRSDGSFRSDGTVYASGTALTSDRRLKSNFEPVDYDIDIIDKVIPQRYDKRIPEGDAKEDGEYTPETTRELGIVAQDLQAVLPDLVSEYYWNEKYPDLLSINYSGLAAWLVGYVANLKDLVKAQGETISRQDGTISKMEARLAEIELRMKSIDGLDA